MTRVTVVETGIANTASVLGAFRRAGVDAVTTHDADTVDRAERLVLPGVGAYASGMARLRERGLVEPIARRVADGRPTLAVCLGMQLLFEGSSESPGVPGIGAIPGGFVPFPDSALATHFGWLRVETNGCALVPGTGHAYFAHSYRLETRPPGWRCASVEHEGAYTAAVEREGVLACQFHPELSGPWGAALVRRWLGVREGVTR